MNEKSDSLPKTLIIIASHDNTNNICIAQNSQHSLKPNIQNLMIQVSNKHAKANI